MRRNFPWQGVPENFFTILSAPTAATSRQKALMDTSSDAFLPAILDAFRMLMRKWYRA